MKNISVFYIFFSSKQIAFEKRVLFFFVESAFVLFSMAGFVDERQWVEIEFLYSQINPYLDMSNTY